MQRVTRETESPCPDVSGSNLSSHQQRCTAEHKRCEHCLQYRLASQLPTHAITCARQQREIDASGMAVIAMQRNKLCSQLLTSAQSRSIRHVAALAQTKSNEAEPALLVRFRRLGFGESHLRVVKRFIRHDAPLNIHLYMDRAGPDLLVGTHYRNCHEIVGAIDSYRCSVESKLFGGHYPGTPAFDRVKYGCLNDSLDPNGVVAAGGYGDSYLILRDEVRARITITSGDIFDECDWYCHILATYSDVELERLVRIVTSQRRHTTDADDDFKEVQVHGPVRLVEDVAALCVNARHSTDRAAMLLVEQFRRRTKTEVIMLKARIS